jgi:hypothetical protein
VLLFGSGSCAVVVAAAAAAANVVIGTIIGIIFICFHLISLYHIVLFCFVLFRIV